MISATTRERTTSKGRLLLLVVLALSGCESKETSPLTGKEEALTAKDEPTSTSCLSAAEKVERGQGRTIDLGQAHQEYKACCQTGVQLACRRWGDMLQRGLGSKRDGPAAVDIFQRACAANDAESCVFAARAFLTGMGAKLDKEAGLKLNLRACKLGHPAGCIRAGESKSKNKKEKDDFLDQAFVLGRKLCDERREAKHCSATARLAKDRHPALARRLQEVAFSLRRAACRSRDDATSCFELGLHFERGIPNVKSRPTAQRMFEKACARGHQEGCRRGNGLKRAQEKRQPIINVASKCRSAKGRAKECSQLVDLCLGGNDLACPPAVKLNLDFCGDEVVGCLPVAAMCKKSKREDACQAITKRYADFCLGQGNKAYCKRLRDFCEAEKTLPGCKAQLERLGSR